MSWIRPSTCFRSWDVLARRDDPCGNFKLEQWLSLLHNLVSHRSYGLHSYCYPLRDLGFPKSRSGLVSFYLISALISRTRNDKSCNKTPPILRGRNHLCRKFPSSKSDAYVPNVRLRWCLHAISNEVIYMGILQIALQRHTVSVIWIVRQCVQSPFRRLISGKDDQLTHILIRCDDLFPPITKYVA